MDDVRPAGRAENPPAGLWAVALVGVAPFFVSAAVYCYGPARMTPDALTALFAWSAVVLSFLGGVRWGLETREQRPRPARQAFAALSAFVALAVLLARGRTPDAWILAAFICAFLVQWLFDHQTPNTPRRYPMLSTVVAGTACVSLSLALEKAING
jgi:hypothetical protein